MLSIVLLQMILEVNRRCSSKSLRIARQLALAFWILLVSYFTMISENLAPHFDAVSVDKVPRIQLSSPLTDANFAFASLHIHVGRGRGKGSEHSMDGKFAPMEVLVFVYVSNLIINILMVFFKVKEVFLFIVISIYT